MKLLTATFSLIIAVACSAETDPFAALFADDFVYADHHVLDASTDLRTIVLKTDQLALLQHHKKVLFDLREIPFRLASSKVRIEAAGETLGGFMASFLAERLYASQSQLWVRYVSRQRIVMFQLDDVPVSLRNVILEPGDCVFITTVGGMG